MRFLNSALLFRFFCIPAWAFALLFAGMFNAIWSQRVDNLVDFFMKPALLVLATCGMIVCFVGGFLLAFGRFHP